MAEFLWILFFVTTKLLATYGYEQFNEYQTITMLANHSHNYTIEVDQTKEVIMRFPDSTSKYPYTVFVWSLQSFFDHPIFIVARQQKSVTSWQLPMPIETKSGIYKFPKTSRTLCHNNMDLIVQAARMDIDSYRFMLHKQLSISISTTSKIPTSVAIRVEELPDFYVQESKEYTVTAAPSEPRFFYYKFMDEEHKSTVVLEVNSEDDTCLTVSIQNATCPVADLQQDIGYEGKHQTVNLKGGIIIKRREFPIGFFIIFVPHGDNFACSHESSIIPQHKVEIVRANNRSTTVTFSVKPSISQNDYLVASMSTLGTILIFYVVFSVTTWGFYRWSNLKKTKQGTTEEIDMGNYDEDASPAGSTSRYADDRVDAALASTNLMVSDLAKKDPEYFEKKSSTYLWHVISIAIFYGIPVVQLVITYQRVVNISGNQDICYYNFLCAHPLFGLSDFNHIYSNIGYVLVGVLFILITCYRQHFVLHAEGCGIPKHYGLFYAMGVAMIMEGVLSACYHICPNQSNFQFDTSFMYVMAVLCIVQIYQKRHPDVNATAYTTFVVLGFAIFAAMVGILNGSLVVWILFIVTYILLCLYVSFNIYFLSYVKRGIQDLYDGWHEDHSLLKAIEPKRKAHFTLLVVANVINVVLANLGILCYYMSIDFATFLLGLLMGNTILYVVVYIIMKLIHHERICVQAWIYCILLSVTWLGATYFFINNSTQWLATPAESRQSNTHCKVLDFYDYHDIWHLLSAAALFFTYMLLLTVDDDLVKTPQSRIAVF